MKNTDTNFDIEAWLPYRLWRLSQQAGFELEEFYSNKFGLDGSDWRTVAAIANYAPISAKELADTLDLSQVQMTRALNKVLDHGLVSRRTDKADKRRIVLNLTKKGVTLYNEISPKAQAVEEHMLDKFSASERKTFLSLFATIEEKIGKGVRLE